MCHSAAGVGAGVALLLPQLVMKEMTMKGRERVMKFEDVNLNRGIESHRVVSH